jgi:hypothetical protein
MRALTIVSVLVVSAIVLPPVSASAQDCPPSWVKRCDPAHRGPRCWCVPGPYETPHGGKAEIHKKNVPTVKPSHTHGPND